MDVVIVYAYYRYVNNFLSEQPHEYKADAGIIFFGDYAEKRCGFGRFMWSDRRRKKEDG